MTEIENKVQKSGIVTLDLEELYPKGERMVIDLAERLWQGLALKEQDFRQWVKEHDWSAYADKFVSIDCTADAIVPTWAYMLVSVHLSPFAKLVTSGDGQALEQHIFTDFVRNLDPSAYADARVVVKGCSKLPVPLSAYAELTHRLTPIVKSLMYGEPCSTVPLFKRPRS
jgi:hypothetical protein